MQEFQRPESFWKLMWEQGIDFLRFIFAEIFGIRKKYYFILLLLLFGVVGVNFFNNTRNSFEQFFVFTLPTKIEATYPKEMYFSEKFHAVGTLKSPYSVQITSEIAGIVEDIYFTEGGVVVQGDPVLKLDSSSYEANVDIAKASLDLSSLNAERSLQLWKNNFAAKKSYDEALAILKKDRANLKKSLDDLEKTMILAPFDGVIGLRAVSTGEYLTPGKAITQIENIDVLNVDFRLPERYLTRLEVGQKVNVISEIYQDKKFVAEIIAFSPKIIEADRTISVRAKYNNTERLLRPGGFVKVEVEYSPRTRIAIPERALLKSKEGNFTYVLNQETEEQKKASAGGPPPGQGFSLRGALTGYFFLKGNEMFGSDDPVYLATKRAVTIGERANDFVEILSGLELNELVVEVGGQKLREGAKTQILNLKDIDESTKQETESRKSDNEEDKNKVPLALLVTPNISLDEELAKILDLEEELEE